LLGLLAASLGPANAAQIQLNGAFKCVAVAGSKTANGTPVIAFSCSGGPEDRWNYVNGQFQGIGTANGAAMCLDVKGGGVTAGTLVDLWPCGTQPNQQWEVEGNQIVALEAGMCLDSSGGPKAGGGTQLVINVCSTAASQDWIVRGLELELNTGAPYLCVNVQGSKTANGTPVMAYSCDGAPNELWNYTGGQFKGLGTDNGKSTCLDVVGAGTTPGTYVDLWPCGTQLNQQWAILNTGTILATQSGLCLDSAGPILGGGTQLVINPCTGASSQNWNVR